MRIVSTDAAHKAIFIIYKKSRNKCECMKIYKYEKTCLQWMIFIHSLNYFPVLKISVFNTSSGHIHF